MGQPALERYEYGGGRTSHEADERGLAEEAAACTLAAHYTTSGHREGDRVVTWMLVSRINIAPGYRYSTDDCLKCVPGR